jgi:hypothetical protein
MSKLISQYTNLRVYSLVSWASIMVFVWCSLLCTVPAFLHMFLSWPECLYAGVLITVVGMGEKDELLYGMYPGNYVMALGDFVFLKYCTHCSIFYGCFVCCVYAMLLISDFSTTSPLLDNTHLNSLSLPLSLSLMDR